MFFNSTTKVSVDSKDWIALFNKNTEYCALKQREMRSSTDINSTEGKTIFKKFVMLLTSFTLASFGSLLTDSAAHAAVVTRWTGQSACVFPSFFGGDYTNWRALIETRSDGASRVIQFQYGIASTNDEHIRSAKLEQSRIIDGGEVPVSPPVTFYPPSQPTAWTSPRISSLQFVSTLFRPRYINVTLNNEDGRRCNSRISFEVR
jgi:hypothetical protein